MTTLKRRILMSEPPSGFLPQEWLNGYQARIQNEETWDKAVFEFTQQKAPKKVVFDISEDIRQQINYWKNRRNDSAHAKDNEISHSHVEMFWLFLQSNLSKLYVGGGPANIINRIKIHFDLSLTPLQADYSTIISDIQHAIPRQQLRAFFFEAESIIRGLSGGSFEAARNRHLEFFEKVITASTSMVIDELAAYIKLDQNRLEDFLYYYPSKIGQLNLAKEFVRSYWRNGSGYISYKALRIIITMLRNNLIPQDEREELVGELITNAYFTDLTDEESTILNEIGFFSRFYQAYIADGKPITDFNKGNRLAPLIIHYLEKFPLTLDLVQMLCETLNQSYYPYSLHSGLKTFLSENSQKLEEFRNVMNANNIPEPSNSIV